MHPRSPPQQGWVWGRTCIPRRSQVRLSLLGRGALTNRVEAGRAAARVRTTKPREMASLRSSQRLPRMPSSLQTRPFSLAREGDSSCLEARSVPPTLLPSAGFSPPLHPWTHTSVKRLPCARRKRLSQPDCESIRPQPRTSSPSSPPAAQGRTSPGHGALAQAQPRRGGSAASSRPSAARNGRAPPRRPPGHAHGTRLPSARGRPTPPTRAAARARRGRHQRGRREGHGGGMKSQPAGNGEGLVSGEGRSPGSETRGGHAQDSHFVPAKRGLGEAN